MKTQQEMKAAQNAMLSEFETLEFGGSRNIGDNSFLFGSYSSGGTPTYLDGERISDNDGATGYAGGDHWDVADAIGDIDPNEADEIRITTV